MLVAAIGMRAFGSTRTLDFAAALLGRGAFMRRNGSNKAMLVVANQIAPAGGNKRFAHELVVLGLAVLDECALHRFL